MNKTRIFAIVILIIGAIFGFFVHDSNKQDPLLGWKNPFKLGLDLNGGTHLVYIADVSAVPGSDIVSSLNALRDVVERRVNIFGVSEPIVQIEQSNILGSDGASKKLVVELPGVTDINEAINMIGKTPSMEFKILTQEDSVRAEEMMNENNPDISTSTLALKTMAFLSLFKDTGITGSSLKRADIYFDQATGKPGVSLNLTKEGKELFAKVTKEHVGDVLAIFLDGSMLSMPVIRQEINDGRAVISGSFTVEEARKLVRDLNYGALPVPITLQSTQTIGASLGEDALNGGVLAGIWAFIAIAVFLIVWYRLPGLMATLALAIYTILMLLLFKLVPVTLTAAGIAGFILSIGMAVDANVLIFERLKEELRKGKDLSLAMHEGFARAWLSIRDSNTSSILTGLILYFFSSSNIIRGFALVFIFGVLVSMFTAITASRIFLYAVAPKSGSKYSHFLFSNGLFNSKK